MSDDCAGVSDCSKIPQNGRNCRPGQSMLAAAAAPSFLLSRSPPECGVGPVLVKVCDKECNNHQLNSSKGNSHHQLEATPAAKRRSTMAKVVALSAGGLWLLTMQ